MIQLLGVNKLSFGDITDRTKSAAIDNMITLIGIN